MASRHKSKTVESSSKVMIIVDQISKTQHIFRPISVKFAREVLHGVTC